MPVVPELLVALWPWIAGLFLLAASAVSMVLTGSKTKTEQGGFISGVWHAFEKYTPLGNVIAIGEDLLGGVTKAARSTLSHWAVAHLPALVPWFNGINRLIRGQAKAQADFAETTAEGFEQMRAKIHERATRGSVSAVKAQAVRAEKTATAAKANAHTAHTALDHYKARTNARLAHAEHSIAVTLPHELGGIRTKNRAQDKALTDLRGAVKGVEDGAVKTFEWLRGHPFSAAMGVFTGAVALALAKLGYPFLRCSSWRRVGRKLTCGNGAAIDSLLSEGLSGFLGALLTAEAVVNFRSIVKVAQTVEHDVASGVKDLLNV
jgi:hypothetical protein